jgi:hypothetical protein
MKNLIRVLLFGLFAGTLFGWWLAHEQQRREEAAEREAYANNPELVAVRAEIERLQKVDEWISGLEDSDA